MPDPLAGLPPRFLRTPEAARFLGLSGRTLEKHRTYGTGPKYRKIGGRVVYALDDLKAWADLGAKTSTSGSWCCNGLPGETERGSKPTRDAVASPLTVEHDRRRRVESRTGGAQSARALAGKGAARWISATARNEHQPLNGALTRLQATAIRSTIRLAEPWRCRQISRINEWRQLISRSVRGEGMEFVLPESFCRSALDRRLVVALDAAYFALSVGIERWLYRLGRSTQSGSQTARIFGFASP